MKDEYTPTTEEVLAHWGRTHTEVGVRALNRWLASVKAEAWAEGYNAGYEYGTDLEAYSARGIGPFDTPEPTNPYEETPL